MDSESIPDDGMKATVISHVLIRDVTTGEILLNQRDITPGKQKGEADAADR